MPNGFSENHEVAVCLLQPFSRWLLPIGGTCFSPCFNKVSTVSIQKFTNRRFMIQLDSNNTGARHGFFGPHLQCHAYGTCLTCCNTSPSEMCAIRTEKQNCFTALKNLTQTLQLPGKKKTSTPFYGLHTSCFWSRPFETRVSTHTKKNPRSWLLQVFRANVKTYGQNH